MNQEPAALTKAEPAAPHCSARTPSGRRCRMAISDPEFGLCFKHAAQLKKDRDAVNVAAQLIRDTDDFTSAVTINRSLTELYKLLARDEIAPRRAAVMAYTCSLLLRTLPAIDLELNPPDEEQQIIFDLPRPKGDWPEGTDPAIAAYEDWASYAAANPSAASHDPTKLTLAAPLTEKSK